MTEYRSLFDQEESEAGKESGMTAAAEKRPSDLELAREIARSLCKANGTANADEVGRLLDERHGVVSLGPAAGSIFKCGFVFTGRRVRSTRTKNHARELKVWRLKRKGES